MSVYLCRTIGQATVAGTNSTLIHQNRFSQRPSGRYFDVRLPALTDSCLGMCLLIVARILEVRCASRTKDCPNTKQENAAGPVTMIYLSFLPSCIMFPASPNSINGGSPKERSQNLLQAVWLTTFIRKVMLRG